MIIIIIIINIMILGQVGLGQVTGDRTTKHLTYISITTRQVIRRGHQIDLLAINNF